MAAMRSRAHAAVGSTKWIHDEREQAGQFIEQEVEEFAFSARNELEWLNEHMAEIFSANQFEVAEVFKTPGKLRGKTPRTARKHTPGTARQPLTDIFTSNTPNKTATPKNDFYQKLAPFQVAEDKENGEAETSPKRSPVRPQSTTKPVQTSPKKTATPPLPPRSPLRPASAKKSPSPFRLAQLRQAKNSRSTGESFVSAKETLSNSLENKQSYEPALVASPDPEVSDSNEISAHADVHIPDYTRGSNQYSVSTATATGLGDALEEAQQRSPERAIDEANNDSASDTSSPGRPIIRKKSSLNFASLPAREPLAKKSVGARISHARPSGKRSSGDDGISTRQSQAPVAAMPQVGLVDGDEEGIEKTNQSPYLQKEPALQSKTSTQRLHERITMLGKTNQARPSKSIPSAQATTANAYSQSHTKDASHEEDIDDDWIGPISNSRTAQRSMHSTQPSTQQSMPGSFSTSVSGWNTQTQDTTFAESQPTQQESPQLAAQSQPDVLPYPQLKKQSASAAPASTTPAGSPMMQRWNVDGPLSASKARFNAFLKSAKGIFASSAAASAQAKMDNLKSPASKSTVHLPLPSDFDDEAEKRPVTAHAAAVNDVFEDRGLDEMDVQPDSPPRRRSSQRLQQKQQSQDVSLTHTKTPVDTVPDAVSEDEDIDMTEDTIAIAAKTTQPIKAQAKPKGLASQSGELRHPNKANKGNKVTKPVAASSKSAMSVRLPSHKTIGNFSSSLHSSNAENRGGPSTTSASKASTLTKKGSNSSLRSGTSTANKSTAASNARLKALDAAAKSKEREEQKQQRKADEKKERERKRAEAEEQKQKKQQEQKAAEQRREREEQEARAAAQKQRREKEEQERLRAEKQNAEMQRKNEALRRQAEVAKAAKARQAEAAELEQPRPVSRPGESVAGSSVRPHVNPAKPKRYYQPEEDERPGARPAAATQTPGYATTQNGSKRRKTGEEEEFPAPPSHRPQSTRPTMAPPVRASMARKQEGALPNRFAHGYMAANTSTIKTAGPSSYTQQPKTPHTMSDLAKFSSAKIPFADVPNPPGPSTATQPGQARQLKTPGTAHKSSPQVPNGDNISLPEIATDSEDDSEDDFVAPDWTASPELRALLERQQLVDPMKVFGPIGELKMEEVFKGNKDRLARFRARTSSANWSGPDRLTEDERRKDREARARLERDGGWSFRPDL